MEARAAVPGMAGAGEERWRGYRLGSRGPWSLAEDSWKCLRVYTVGLCHTARWLRLREIQMAVIRERGAGVPLNEVRACQRLRPAMLRRWPAVQ